MIVSVPDQYASIDILSHCCNKGMPLQLPEIAKCLGETSKT